MDDSEITAGAIALLKDGFIDLVETMPLWTWMFISFVFGGLIL